MSRRCSARLEVPSTAFVRNLKRTKASAAEKNSALRTYSRQNPRSMQRGFFISSGPGCHYFFGVFTNFPFLKQRRTFFPPSLVGTILHLTSFADFFFAAMDHLLCGEERNTAHRGSTRAALEVATSPIQ